MVNPSWLSFHPFLTIKNISSILHSWQPPFYSITTWNIPQRMRGDLSNCAWQPLYGSVWRILSNGVLYDCMLSEIYIRIQAMYVIFEVTARGEWVLFRSRVAAWRRVTAKQSLKRQNTKIECTRNPAE